MTKLQCGDRAAFDTIFDRHAHAVIGYCMRALGGNLSLSEDIAQEVWCKVVRKAHLYSGPNSFRGWLMTITRHELVSELRRLPPPAAPELEEDDMQGSAEDGAEFRLIHFDDARAVRDAVDSLPGPQRAALSLWLVEGMTHEQIAAALQMTEASARSHLFRARAAMRKKLEQK